MQFHNINEVPAEISVKVLNCDSISQVKEKILDAFFKGFPFSKRPHVDDLDLVYIGSADWAKNTQSKLILFDEDKTSKVDNDNEYKRINTLAHYKITSGSLLVLVPRHTYQLTNSTNVEQFNTYSLIDMANGKNSGI